ncbi:hypothetical protein OHC33_000004 [Knufia fluminis]|uniref:AB hydrolase-1 domain-containing protein n=1 Tax=Knufia fluminis TaxID=191047 RepID=A0AAN8ESW8_9EURO|nr:hypothetical protein OHC33_000004 [Knufia fluminis]
MADSDSEVASRPQQSLLASRRQQESDTSKKQSRFAGIFPLGYKEGFSQWWSAPSAADAEHKVLSFIPYLQSPPTHTQTGSEPPSRNPSTMNVSQAPEDMAKPITTNSITDPYGPRTWHSRMVQLAGKNKAMNEFSVERTGEEADQNLVILHGYGAGLGFFYKNFEGLSRPKGWHLYALDMLGMGRSSRPPFKIHAKSKEAQIREAEDWFIDSLEEWRKKKNIDKMTLVGHSMGGYMAVCYALKYPGRLNKLILASPVGIPEDPYAVKADMPEPPDSTLASEFTQDQESESRQQNLGDNNNFLNAQSRAEKDQAKQAPNSNRLPASKGDTPRRPLPKWLTYLWDANISPFSLVRWSGPLGPRLVSGWTSRRFSHLPPEEALALHDYSYSLFKLRGSGEYALAYILAPGAFARSPLIKRIGGVGRQQLPQTADASAPSNMSSSTESFQNVDPAAEVPSSKASKLQKETGIPVVLMYGENDWMDVKGGYAAADLMNAERRKALASASEEDKRNDRGSAKVVIIKKAGHHVYLDNADHFNQVMLEEMEDVRKHASKMAG